VAKETRSQRRARREASELSNPSAATPAPGEPPAAGKPPKTAANGGAEPEHARRRGFFGRVWGFIGESSAELKKVEWPTQSQLVTGTTVVLIACIIVGFYLYLNDQLWKYVVQHIFL
jgi:preprotein translocase subunit SecE